MQQTALYKELEHINHSRERRGHFAALIINNDILIPQVLNVIGMVDKEISCKAAWALEFACKEQLQCLFPFLKEFTALLPKVYKDPAVRPMAKICEYLIIAYYHRGMSPVKDVLHLEHRQKISETCFDWLITDQKVAAKAYAMTCLQLLGKEFPWIHPELKATIENQYASQSAAFKARSRMILKKI